MNKFIFALITSFLFCAQASAADKIRVSVTNYNMSYLAAGVAAKRGFFKEEGLDVEIVRMNANVAMSSLISGDVDYTMIFASVIRAAMRGIPLKVIAVLIDSPPYAFIARPEITAMKALKGKTVGVSRFGAATDFGMRMFLAKHGLAAHRDVAFIQIGGMPEIATALSKKIIAAAPMSYPMVYVAEQGGAKVLANLAKDEIPFVHLTLTTTKLFLKDKRPQAKAFLRAYGKAVHFLYNRQAESLAIFAKYTKIKDQKMLEGSLKYGYEFMEKVPFVKRAGFQVTLDEIARTNPKAKQAKPEQFFDNSIVQELVDEGFFAKLWGKNP